ncbi:MAG: hypothetical protein KME64_38990 [Scytonematopsis contorta HA4267-MV1]|jgi:hypothetical protein|nr:hypothetical protein [Scytonematopsis contorta HA4267-MV1]
MKKLKLAAYGLIGAFAISTIGLASAYALEVPVLKDSPLASVFEQWQQQFTSLNKYVSDILSRKLEPLAESLGGDLQAAIDEAMGVLGLPDSTEAREKVEDIAASTNSAVNTVERTTNEVDRQISRAQGSSTLSKAGQQRTREQVEKTQTSIEQVYSDADAAQSEVVTQNVMKRIAQQNTQTAAILGAMRTDGLKLQQSQDLANLNLTNISRSLDGQNQARQKESVGQGFSNLRTASQARLF